MTPQLIGAFKAFFNKAAANAISASLAIATIHYITGLSVGASFVGFFFMCGLFEIISEPFLAGWRALK